MMQIANRGLRSIDMAIEVFDLIIKQQLNCGCMSRVEQLWAAVRHLRFDFVRFGDSPNPIGGRTSPKVGLGCCLLQVGYGRR